MKPSLSIASLNIQKYSFECQLYFYLIMNNSKFLRAISQFGSKNSLLETALAPIQKQKIPQNIVQDIQILKHTAAHYKVVSLSANQIEMPHRMFAIANKKLIKPGQWKLAAPINPNDYQIIVNPELQSDSKIKFKDIEECPSFQGLQFHVWNPIFQKYKYLSPSFQQQQIVLKEKSIELKGFHARIWDHESRHLSGVLPIDQQISHRQFFVANQFKGNPALNQYVKILKQQMAFFQPQNMKKYMEKEKNINQKGVSLDDVSEKITPSMRSAYIKQIKKVKEEIQKHSKRQ